MIVLQVTMVNNHNFTIADNNENAKKGGLIEFLKKTAEDEIVKRANLLEVENESLKKLMAHRKEDIFQMKNEMFIHENFRLNPQNILYFL
ncbi:hypothetical protein Glove_19g9 [Diversispora epigaea]|uniref:Uncharacterized protein n=1 Tax=Diversispora epigaea TaxID=1348612 RepID=A0A397JQ22_9GLOM|nr:hypothetical protein Glove_19g9 [Diversispora epigaea]